MRLERPLKWDPQAERFAGDDEANATLSRAPRAPFGTNAVLSRHGRKSGLKVSPRGLTMIAASNRLPRVSWSLLLLAAAGAAQVPQPASPTDAARRNTYSTKGLFGGVG